MGTFVNLFFLVATCIFWIPVVIFWGLLKSILSIILSIFSSFQSSGTEAFGTALSDIIKSILMFFNGGFDVIINIWNWSGQNTTGSIILAIVGIYIFFYSFRFENFLPDTLLILFVALGCTGAFLITISILYLIISTLVALYFNNYLFSSIYTIIVSLLIFKIAEYWSDALINRNLDRDERYRLGTLTHSKRFFLKFSEALLFTSGIITLILFFCLVASKLFF